MTGNGEPRTSILEIFREVRALVHEEVDRVETSMKENRTLIDDLRVEVIPEIRRQLDLKLGAFESSCSQCRKAREQFEKSHLDAARSAADAKKHADSIRVKRWQIWTAIIVALIGETASIILALRKG